MERDDTQNPDDPNGSTGSNWWEGPRPPYVPATAPWPPPLPPGASYGPNVGQIIYAPGTQPANPAPQPGVDTPVTVDQPHYYPAPNDNTPPTAPPPDDQTPPDIYHGALTAPFSGVFTPPEGTFTPGTFTAPSVADALKDPGWQFRRDQGRDMLQSWAAAKGTLNDSETGKALIDYGQDAASQEYASVFDRSLNTFKTNEGERFQGFNTNYQDAWTQFLNQQNEYDSWQDRVWNKVFGAATA